jgi:hypothetical protein
MRKPRLERLNPFEQLDDDRRPLEINPQVTLQGVPPLVRRPLRVRRPVPSKPVLARRAAGRSLPDGASWGGTPRCARAEGTGW